MNRFLNYIIVCCLLISQCACNRIEELCMEPNHPHGPEEPSVYTVPFATAYTYFYQGNEEEISNAPVQVYIYDEDGQLLPLQTHTGELTLPEGNYRALATNQHTDAIQIEGHETPHTLSAVTQLLTETRGGTLPPPPHGHACYLYGSQVVEFSVGKELNDDPVTRQSDPIHFRMSQRAMHLRLTVTVNRPALVLDIEGLLMGMATSINLSTGNTTGLCSVIPTVTGGGLEPYRMEAIILGASPDEEQFIELTVHTFDGNTHLIREKLESTMFTIEDIDKYIEIPIIIDASELWDGEITLTAKIEQWLSGDEVTGGGELPF